MAARDSRPITARGFRGTHRRRVKTPTHPSLASSLVWVDSAKRRLFSLLIDVWCTENVRLRARCCVLRDFCAARALRSGGERGARPTGSALSARQRTGDAVRSTRARPERARPSVFDGPRARSERAGSRSRASRERRPRARSTNKTRRRTGGRPAPLARTGRVLDPAAAMGNAALTSFRKAFDRFFGNKEMRVRRDPGRARPARARIPRAKNSPPPIGRRGFAPPSFDAPNPGGSRSFLARTRPPRRRERRASPGANPTPRALHLTRTPSPSPRTSPRPLSLAPFSSPADIAYASSPLDDAASKIGGHAGPGRGREDDHPV